MSSRVQVVRPDCPVSEAARLMGEARVSCLVVVDGLKPLGILTEKDLLRLLNGQQNEQLSVGETMTASVVTACAETDFRSAYALLRKHRIRHLVVANDSGELIGVVSATDFRTHLSQEVFSKIDHLHAVLDPVVSELPAVASLAQAVKLMVEAQWDYVLVVENRIPLGIVTERDIPRLWSADLDPETIPLDEVMTRPLHCIPVSMQVGEASAAMARLRVRHLPVVDEDGCLLGVVSQNRMLEKLGLTLFDDVWRDHVSLRQQKRELETRLGLILEATGFGVWDYDHATDGLVWSHNLARLCGRPEGWAPAGLAGWMELVHPLDRARTLERFRSALAPHDPLFECEYRILGADGQWLWMQALGRVLQRDAEGNPQHTAGSMMNVSERKNAELLLEAQRTFMEALIARPDRSGLLKAALEFALDFPDLDGGAVFRRKRGLGFELVAQVGFSEELPARWEEAGRLLPEGELLRGKMYCSCRTHDHLCPVAAMPCNKCGCSALIDDIFPGRDGALAALLLPLGVEGDADWEGCLILLCRHAPRVSTGTAKALQTLANLFDQAMLRLRAQEEAARQNELVRREKRFSEELINALPGGFYMTDAQGRLLRWNRAVQEITGYTDAALSTLSGTEFFREEDRLRVQAAIADALAAGSTTVEAGLISRSGDVIPFLFTLRRTEIDGQDYLLTLGLDISETKQLWRTLDEERLRLRSLLNTIPDLVWLKDPDGVFLCCNPSFERLLAVPEADIVGRTDYDFAPKALANSFRQQDCTAATAGVSVISEEWLTSISDGTRGLYETIRTPLLKQGDLVGVLGIARDITERRRTEEALHCSVQEYQDLVAQIPIGVYKMRMLRAGGHTFDYVSPRWCEILGVQAGDVLADAKHAFEHIHPADREGFLCANQTARESLGRFEWEGRIIKNGEVRWLHVESRPTEQENGDVLWNGIQYDVTDRRNAEETLRRSAGVFHNSQEGIIITDAENAITDVNPAFSHITGYSREEVIGRNPKLLSSGIQGREFYERMWRTVLETGNWRGEVCNRRKSGELYTEMLSIAAVRDEHGRIMEFIGVFSDISRLKEHAAELNRIAHYDTLTGLPNRRLLADRLGLSIARARRSGKLLAVCYLDLDGFKPVNDRFGHDAGDQLLVMLTRHLQDVLRAEDTLARLGGDEFVLLLNDLVRDQECGQLLERVLSAVSRPLLLANNVITLSASIGVTLYPHDNADGDTLLRHADQAMYRAKESGRNRYHLFDPEYDRQVRVQREFLNRVSRGLRDGEFVLYYQPKVHLISGDVVGMEALIRWQHPTRGILTPNAFLPMLSGTDVDGQLGEWVIDAALSQLVAWQAQGLDLTVSANISAEHLLSPDFAHRLEAAIQRHPGACHGSLELEILESVAISDLEQASRALQAGLSLGVRFALDDFGTGYSSLTYFRRLPVETLKVDGSFVRDMLDDPDDLGIVESVVRLAEAFNRQVIAEGVETPEHGMLLVKLGCKLGQGYGIARPMPAEAVQGWIDHWYATRPWQYLGSSCVPSEDTALLLAVVSHRQWGERVASYVAHPNGDIAPALDSHACRLGQWYYRGGRKRYGQIPQFKALEAVHERFHAVANELASLAASKNEAAKKRLPELLSLRDSLLASLEGLIAHVQGS